MRRNLRESNNMKNSNTQFVSETCRGEKCGFSMPYQRTCGQPAVMKVGEEIAYDDPNPERHNFTQYVCREHADRLLHPTKLRASASPATESAPEPAQPSLVRARFPNRANRDTTWVDKEGNQFFISDLTDEHLKNVLQHLYKLSIPRLRSLLAKRARGLEKTRAESDDMPEAAYLQVEAFEKYQQLADHGSDEAVLRHFYPQLPALEFEFRRREVLRG